MLILLNVELRRRFMKNDWKRKWCGLYGLLMIFSCAGAPAVNVPPAKMASRQAIVVKTAGWNASEAVLQAYERESEYSSWVAVGRKIPVVAGRNGMGWGDGLHQAGDAKSGPVKREGDGRAPAGIFRLGSAFGYDRAEMTSWIRIPYKQMTAAHRCVNDVHSIYYNRIVDAGQVRPDWSSSEEMLRRDNLYHLGIVVDHNVDPVASGRGSCIFLHVWEGPARGTSGCTAMDKEDLELLLLWLLPEAGPVLVQLPEAEYAKIRDVWGLP